MGTSAPGKGPRPTTPLIPSWISDNDSSNQGTQGDTSLPNTNTSTTPESEISTPPENSNRYYEARRRLNNFSKDRTAHASSLKGSLKSYVRKSGGGSSRLAKRMRPSASRIARFYSVINSFQTQGAEPTLRSFHLENYINRPLLDVLSALSDVIFDSSSPYNNIQDDSITKLAYANTINRIVEQEGIDLDTLRNEDVEVMMAIFIEETIVTRVICDIGVNLFDAAPTCEEAIEIEEAIYQVVSGLVRNQIMQEIRATHQGQSQNLERNIENIYRIAFDCITDIIQS